MNNVKPSDIILAAGILAGILVSFILSSSLESRRTGSGSSEQEELYLQGEKLKGYVLGSEGLIADWYWMRSLQYIGEKIQNSKEKTINIDNLRPLNPKLLYPLLDNATTLDPQFMAVYSYGATVLPAIDEKQAIAIASKGIANNPDEWILYHQLGFIYWKLGNYKAASETYLKGSAINGAPGWMNSMAARMNAQGGSRQTARAIYTQIYESAGDDMTRKSASLHLARLDSLEDLEVLNEVLAEFNAVRKRCADGWKQVIPILTEKQLPRGREFRTDDEGNIVDPTGIPYLIDSSECKAKPDLSRTGLPKN